MHDHAWDSTLLAVGLEPQLFVDNLLTASAHDATRRWHRPRRSQKGPLFTEHRPWTASTGRSTRRRRSSAAAAEAPATSTSSGTTSTRASSSFNIRAHRSARPDGRPARTERRNLFRRRTATVRHRATTQVSLARGSPHYDRRGPSGPDRPRGREASAAMSVSRCMTYSRVIQMWSALVRSSQGCQWFRVILAVRPSLSAVTNRRDVPSSCARRAANRSASATPDREVSAAADGRCHEHPRPEHTVGVDQLRRIGARGWSHHGDRQPVAPAQSRLHGRVARPPTPRRCRTSPLHASRTPVPAKDGEAFE